MSLLGVEITGLNGKEYELALIMFRNLGRLLSRAHLIESVWGIDADISSRSLDVYMSHVRSKLRLRADNGYKLVSVYNMATALKMWASRQRCCPAEHETPCPRLPRRPLDDPLCHGGNVRACDFATRANAHRPAG